MSQKDKITEKVKNALSGLIFDVVTNIPESLYTPADDPEDRVQRLIKAASMKAAAVSTTLSIPAGITGVLAALPDIAATWRIQAQLISDIAATYGKIAVLNRKAMMICLFKHSIAHIVKDVAVHTGTRLTVHKLTTEAFRKTVQRISLHFSSKLVGRMFVKAIPFIGAASNGAISYWDTKKVGKTAHAYFKTH